ncbi:MAG: hypothetical protein M3P06_07430 [Acidobacteriota bacterium]|nr:hypothetical protein [Acidobacteriota bacterium]
MADGYAKIGDVVPSFFYDLIARIIPGAAVVTLGAYFYPIDRPIELPARIALIGGAGYLAGFALSAISTFILFAITRAEGWEKYSDEAFWMQIRKHKDDRETSALLAKMVAESTCCENLVVGVMAVAMLDPARGERICLYCLALGLAVLVASVRREILKRRLDSP